MVIRYSSGMAPPRSSKSPMIAGTPCLDFANTVSGRGRTGQVDRLRDYDDLLDWSVQAGVIKAVRARELRRAQPRHPQRVADIFKRSIALREAIYAIFSAVAAGKLAPRPALETLNDELVEAMRNARIVPERSRGFDWQLPHEVCGLFFPLQAVTRDAAELLTSRHLKEVRECANETCAWLFLDETRNHSRLWCEMRVCGNRKKQARYRKSKT